MALERSDHRQVTIGYPQTARVTGVKFRSKHSSDCRHAHARTTLRAER